jgi:hypothetical protein
MCFISLLSIGHRTINRDATWWSWQNQSAQNPEIFQEWCKEIKFQECAEICPTGQTSWTYPRVSPVQRTCPVPLPDFRYVYRTCPILDQTSLVNNLTVGIWAPADFSGPHRTYSGPNPNLPIQIVSFRECPELVWGHPTDLTSMMDQSDRYGLTAPTASFLDSYKRHSTPPPSLVG